MQSIRRQFADLINSGIAPTDPRFADSAYMRCLQTFNGCNTVLVLLTAPFFIYYIVQKDWTNLVSVTFGALFEIGAIVFIRRGGPAKIAIGAQLGYFLSAATTASIYSGGIFSPFLMMFPMTVAFAGLVLGLTAAITCGALAVACIIAIYFLMVYGLVPLSVESQTLQSMKALLLAASFITVQVATVWAFLRAQQDSETRLLSTNRDLRDAHLAAESATAAKSEFLANMSHEIRTPMNGVLGMTGLLLDTELDPAQRDYAETVNQSAHALLGVINDILDFSKVEAGKLELEQIDFNLRETLEDVAKLLATRAHEKSLELSVQIAPKLPEFVNGDPGRLRQILLNLVSNAVKFTEHGTVSIHATLIEQTDEDTLFQFEVVDTGLGISEQQLQNLFTPFAQADTSTTRRFGGTGLGLSIASRLTELMQGTIGVKSTVGSGSSFWFTARLRAARAPRQTVPRLPSSISGLNVLVVDDNAVNRKVLMGQLQQCDAEASCAGSAAEALELLYAASARGKSFDVALLDYGMPDCNGAQLGEMIVQDAKFKSTRLILLTSSGELADAQSFAKLGFAGYLLKPVAQRELANCLRLVSAQSAEVWHVQSQPIVTQRHIDLQPNEPRARLLIAEDNPVNQKVAERLLQKMNYSVDVVGDGRAALAAWQTGVYDLILMDCQMPEMDGYEATREIRRRENGGARIPIIALTAHAMKGADQTCLDAGMDGYLSKPIDRDLLRTQLEEALRPSQSLAHARA